MPKPSNNNSRPLNKYIHIFTEGAVTEIKYFQGLIRDRKLTAAKAEKTKNHAPLGLVDAAIKAKKEAKKLKFDDADIHVWVVFDCDGHANISQAIHKAEANGINVAFSNVCFELWVLLHYTYSTAPHWPCASIIDEVKKHNPSYSKEGTYDIYAALKAKISDARDNAERLRKATETSHPDDNFWDINPYTNVNELVDFLLSS